MVPETHTEAATGTPDSALLPAHNEAAAGATSEERRDPVAKPRGKFDRLLALAGTGKGLWGDEGADEYVRKLREDW